MKNSKGFTLVEILVSIFILTVLGATFFQCFVFSQKATAENEDKLVAINLAQSVLEQVKNGEYPEITKPNKTYNFTKDVNGEEFGVEVKISEELKSNNLKKQLGIYEINVTVYGEDGKVKSSVKGVGEIWPSKSSVPTTRV